MKSVLLLLVLSLFSCSHKSKVKEGKQLSDQDYRPAYHFTPEANWMNDPNGMVYYAGEYHLFYQYYPDGNTWGPMHWGHAISTDLLTWEHLPIALYPDDLGYIFSGSAVVDKNNTAGFKTGDEEVLIAIFTHHSMEKEKAGTHDHQYQSIAYSNDKGRTWVKYKGNPVLPNTENIHDFRDPKVSWHEASKQWVMILAAGQRVKLYTSPNLIDWTFASDFGMGIGAHGGVWECPDLFELKVGDANEKKWVMLVSINPGGPNGGSATQYFVGDFDGETFTTDQTETLWVDMGTDNYAGVTWSNAPDERKIFMGWMSNWTYATEVPTNTWRSAMTLPRELKLQVNADDYFLSNFPVKEVSSHNTEIVYSMNKTSPSVNVENLATDKFHLSASINMKEANAFNLIYGNDGASINISYDKGQSVFTVDRSHSGYDFKGMNENIITANPKNLLKDELNLDVWVDKSSIELFVNNGELVMTQLFFPFHLFDNLKLNVDGNGEINTFVINQL